MGVSCEWDLKKGQGSHAVWEGESRGAGVEHNMDLVSGNPPQKSREECVGMGQEKCIAFRGWGYKEAQFSTEGRLIINFSFSSPHSGCT